MGRVTLYHWEPNANSGKPILALIEKGVAFESRYMDLCSFDQHRPNIWRQPARNDPGHDAWRSGADRVHGDHGVCRRGVPRAEADAGRPRDRWRVRWWMKFLDSGLGRASR